MVVAVRQHVTLHVAQTIRRAAGDGSVMIEPVALEFCQRQILTAAEQEHPLYRVCAHPMVD